MSLQPTTLRRLAFIKYLYRLGIQQSETPDPFSSVSLLHFHDAIELFLQLSCEHLNAEVKERASLMDTWDALSKKLPSDKELSQRESVKRLNRARVDLKHAGILPPKLEIEAFQATATNFFEDNTPIVFDTTFSTISMNDYVQPEQAREYLQIADKMLEHGVLVDALDHIALAFRIMLDDYESRKRDRFYDSPFFFGQDFTFDSSSHMGLDGRSGYSLIDDKSSQHHHKYEKELGKFVDKVKESLEAMQEAVRMLAMGIDYRRYTKFKMLTPYVYQTMDEKYHTHQPADQEFTKSDVEFCIEFVVETAIKLQEFDYSLPTRT